MQARSFIRNSQATTLKVRLLIIKPIRCQLRGKILYVRLAEDLNLKPSNLKYRILVCKCCLFSPLTLQNWTIFFHSVQ